jgi:hypothetical protein
MSTSAASPAVASESGRQRIRFSSRTIAIATTFIALGLALVVQNQRLSNLRAALSRYESTTVPVTLAPGQFRVIVQPILDVDHAQVMKYRIECADKPRLLVGSPQGHTTGSLARRDPNSGLYIAEVTFLADHVQPQNCVKMVLNGDGALLTAVDSVNAGYALRDHLSIRKADGVYAANETPAIFTWDGQTYSVSVK